MKYVTGFLTALLLVWVINVFGNQPKTNEDYMIDSIQEASKRLNTFVKQEQLNRSDFLGPYLFKTDNPEPPTFITCYKNSTSHFCYRQWDSSVESYQFDGDCHGYHLCEWLENQT